MRSVPNLIRRLSCAALIAACAGPLAGCIIVNGEGDGDGHSSWNDSSSTVKEVRRFEIAHQPAMPMQVRTENGGVEIDRAPQASMVVVTATVRAKNDERLAATKVIAERDASGAVKVSVVWPDDRRRDNEGCSFEITTPDARGVDVETSNGSIRISDLAGEARLQSSNGRITIAKHDGPANVRTSNGSIDVERLNGELVARTSNGAIDARQITGAVDADTSNGSVQVTLSEDARGPVRIDSSNGAVDLECGAKFAGEVVMSTSNSGVRFSDGSGRVIRGKDRLQATIGQGGPRSTVSTSNGSIEVRVAGAAQSGG